MALVSVLADAREEPENGVPAKARHDKAKENMT
jgi:hypothetical protein